MTLPESREAESSKVVVQTNWKLCVLCQKDTVQKLVYPDERKNTTSGYDSLAKNILKFHNLEALPLDIDISRLDDGSGISQTLQSNHAGWHKSCSLLFCAMKLKRAEKRAKKRKAETEEIPSPVKTRSSLGNINSYSEAQTQSVCFFL